MIEHRNVVNFFTGMDRAIGRGPGVWLAVTSISFDISVLELLWTLTRGFQVVIHGAGTSMITGSSSSRPRSLQPVYGGAHARPFTSYHKFLDQKLFLRIAPELYLKRLVVGGFEKVFEIALKFPGQAVDTDHNPEFSIANTN